MRKKGRSSAERFEKFFSVSLCDETLENRYKTNFHLMYYQKFSLEELENMIPFEREIYLLLLNEQIRRENEEMQKASQRK